MRLQTMSPRHAGYLSLARPSWGYRRLLKQNTQNTRHFQVISKTGHGTVLVNRAQKPQTEKTRCIDIKTARGEQLNHRHVQVKHKWHISNARRRVDRGRLATTKPYTPSAAKPATSNGTQPNVDLAPSLVPNRAFPFIKHAGEQPALGLHKPIGLVLASAYLLGAVCQLSGTPSTPRFLLDPVFTIPAMHSIHTGSHIKAYIRD